MSFEKIPAFILDSTRPDISEYKEDLMGTFKNALDVLYKRGFADVKIDATRAIKDYNGLVYAVPVELFDAKKQEEIEVWIKGTAEDGNMKYEIPELKLVLHSVPLPKDFDEKWLQNASETSKIVKSRPMFLYPHLFDLPTKEVWPDNADLMVIGDPFQACDRERTTIIEYEYIDEITPAIFRFLLKEKTDQDVARKVFYWFSDVYFEDLRAAESPFHSLIDSRNNPYHVVSEAAFKITGEIYSAAYKPDAEERVTSIRLRASLVKRALQKLQDHSWSISDVDSFYSREEDRKGLFDALEYKNDELGRLGKEQTWTEYSQLWTKYLADLERKPIPLEGLEQKIKQARYWLTELPQMKSIDRINRGIAYLQDFYGLCLQHYDYKDRQTAYLFRTELSDVGASGMMADNPFGIFTPGRIIDGRVAKLLKNAEYTIEAAEKYASHVAPKLKPIYERALQTSLGDSEIENLMRSYEHPLAVGFMTQKRAKKSVPLHGYFPYEMPQVGQQDRILALTSVTMHGWNYLDESGFYNDLDKAISFLKVGGKYILGPVNQYVYFGNSGSEFDTEGLVTALNRLRSEGKIDFEFFGKRNPQIWDEDTGNYIDDDEEGPRDELQKNAAAASLVVTRKR